jgi:hypothetical protein
MKATNPNHPSIRKHFHACIGCANLILRKHKSCNACNALIDTVVRFAATYDTTDNAITADDLPALQEGGMVFRRPSPHECHHSLVRCCDGGGDGWGAAQTKTGCQRCEECDFTWQCSKCNDDISY